MMKKIPFITLLILSIASRHLYSEETQVQPASRTGQAALAGQETATKWYMGAAVGATGLLAFGLITFLASSDPTTFSHSHYHSH